MLAYKGFNKGLTCRDYKFLAGKKSITKEANCVKNGFHAAEDPLDVFKYYPNIEESEYWLVRLEGDIHEDGNDSKISCTELTPIRELSIPEMAAAALIYIQKHPNRTHKENYSNKAFKIAVGENPVLSGELGQFLGFAVRIGKEIPEISIFQIDGEQFLPNTEYDYSGAIVGN